MDSPRLCSRPLALPLYAKNGRSQPRDHRSDLREAVLGSATPETVVQTIGHTVSSNDHSMTQPPRPHPSSRGRHKYARTKSDSRRLCTPAPPLTSCGIGSPRSVTTVSSLSPISQASRHRACSATGPALNKRSAGFKDDKFPNGIDISLPVPTPASRALGENAFYQPRRLAPTTPPLRTSAQATPSIDAETSFMEWDDEISAVTKMKETLKLRQKKKTPRAISVSESQTKSPDKQENATPRALPVRAKQHSTPPQSLDTRQPLTGSNFIRPKKTCIHASISSSPSTSAPGEHASYQGPDPVGIAIRLRSNILHGQPNKSSAKWHEPLHDHANTPRGPHAKLPQHVHRHRPQHQRQRRNQHNRYYSIVPSTTNAQSSPRKAHPRPAHPMASEYDVQNTHTNSSPFLANEASPVEPPTPTSTRTDATTSTGKSIKLKALMQGLVKRASGRDLN